MTALSASPIDRLVALQLLAAMVRAGGRLLLDVGTVDSVAHALGVTPQQLHRGLMALEVAELVRRENDDSPVTILAVALSADERQFLAYVAGRGPDGACLSAVDRADWSARGIPPARLDRAVRHLEALGLVWLSRHTSGTRIVTYALVSPAEAR